MFMIRKISINIRGFKYIQLDQKIQKMTKKIILSATIYLCLILKISCLKVFIKSVDGTAKLVVFLNYR